MGSWEGGQLPAGHLLSTGCLPESSERAGEGLTKSRGRAGAQQAQRGAQGSGTRTWGPRGGGVGAWDIAIHHWCHSDENLQGVLNAALAVLVQGPAVAGDPHFICLWIKP